MEELSNKLVITLLVLIVVSTVISTIAFLNLEPTVIVNDISGSQGSAKATIQIVDGTTNQDDVSASAEASIQIKEPEQ